MIPSIKGQTWFVYWWLFCSLSICTDGVLGVLKMFSACSLVDPLAFWEYFWVFLAISASSWIFLTISGYYMLLLAIFPISGFLWMIFSEDRRWMFKTVQLHLICSYFTFQRSPGAYIRLGCLPKPHKVGAVPGANRGVCTYGSHHGLQYGRLPWNDWVVGVQALGSSVQVWIGILQFNMQLPL